MATGGSPSKGSSSDSHTRSGWQSTSDDAVSINSILNELRPNNLEVSEWKDSTIESSQRRKKGNRERERERGQSLLQETHSERHQIPATYPRIKLASNSQIDKMELEKLRRRISFDGLDEISTDDEKNNDMYMSSSNRRDISANHSRRRPNMPSTSLTTNSEKKKNKNNENDTCDESGVENDDEEEKQMYGKQASTNKLKDDRRTQEAITDSNQIVARLMQIKDYLKQVKLMMDTLEQSDDPSDHRKVSKLAQVMSSLQEQEKSYMEILQKLWVIRRHAMMNSQSFPDEISKQHSPDVSDSLEFDEKSVTSDSSMQNIEPHLDERRDNMFSAQHHQQLLKQIIEQKEQLKILQQRQEALLTIEKDAVKKLAEAREKQIFLEQQTMEESLSSPTSEAEEHYSGNQLPENGLSDQHSDSKSHQNNLPPANHHSEENSFVNIVEANGEISSDMFRETISHGRLSLQNKLHHLQEKRKYVDELLNYVKTLHGQRRDQLQPMNNDSEPLTSALSGAELAVEKLDSHNRSEINLGESSCKWEELQEMRERLNHLRSLFQQCQNHSVRSKDDMMEKEANPHNTNDMQITSLESGDKFSEINNIPNQSDIEDEAIAVELGTLMCQPGVQDKFNELQEVKDCLKHLQNLIGKLNENNDQLTSIKKTGEIAEAVSKMEESTTLVWPAVDQSREGDSARRSHVLDDEEGSAEVSEDQLVPLQNKSTEMRIKMHEQLREVERLKEQRKKLLSFHQQLLKFHDSLPNWTDRIEKTSEVTFAPEPFVQEMGQIAYSSNDELYNKMRKERIQREELRQKKKEMEDLMHKDKPKRHYSRNQDNQSDSVSYSTDFLGANASADITMATWGGSTADNLESINEDCDRREKGENDEDDDNDDECNDYNDDEEDYQSDDIIQIEEEECSESSSKETYTIEKDAEHHHDARECQASPLKDLSRSRNTFQSKKNCRYNGLQNEVRIDSRHNVYDRDTLSERFSHKKTKQENIRAAEYIIQEDECDDGLHSATSPLTTLERQMNRMTMTYQELLSEQQLLRQQLYLIRYQNGNTSTFETSPNSNFYWQPNLMVPPLEQQDATTQHQMVFALNQCFQHLSLQQTEMNNLQRQMHSLNLERQSAKNLPLNQAMYRSTNKSNQFSWDPNFQSSAHCTDTLTGSFMNSTSTQKSNKKGNIFCTTKSKKRPNPSSAVQYGFNKKNQKKKCSKDCNQTCSYYWNFTGAENFGCQENSYLHLQYKKQSDSVPQKYSVQSQEYTHAENSKRKPKSSLPENNCTLSKSSMSNLSTQKLSNKSLSEQKIENAADVWLNKESHTPFSESAEEQMDAINFDNLKSDIYAEVAKLISQNEKYPKYLICLFQKLQCLTSDCMRQHALQSLGDIIREKEEDEKLSLCMSADNLRPFLHPKASFDDAKIIQSKSQRNKRSNGKKRERSALKGEECNYENVSCISSPFVEDCFINDSSAMNLHSLHASKKKQDCKNISNDIEFDHSCSSVTDQISESSILDMISEPKLERSMVHDEIKSTLNQLLPFLKLHKDQVFSAKLLAEIKQNLFQLLSQTNMKNINYSKLSHMLEIALSEFQCQSVHSSYKNVLLKVSEIIYNEFTYVRLMEDLGKDSLSEETLKKFGIIETVNNEHSAEEECNVEIVSSIKHDVSSIKHEGGDELPVRKASFYKMSNGILSESKTDYEILKKQQMLNGDIFSDSDQCDEVPLQSSAMKIELAVSETKPFSRIGSDEDDEDDEESHTAEDPSITAISLAIEKECLSAEKGDGDLHLQNKCSPSLEKEGSVKATTSPLNLSTINMASSSTLFNHPEEGSTKTVSLQIDVENLPNRLHTLNHLEDSPYEQCSPAAAFFDNLVNGTELVGDGEAVNKFENSATNLATTKKDDIDQ